MTTASPNTPDLLWPGIRKIWGAEYKKWPELYPQVFESLTSDKVVEKEQGMTGYGTAAVKDQGASITYDELYQGFQKEYVHVAYGLGGLVTEELWEDEQYNHIKKIPKFLARSLRETEEIICWNHFNYAFTAGTAYAGADGVSLCNASHPLVVGGTTQTNIPAVAADLTQTSLEEAITAIMDYIDDRGLRIMIQPKKLLVPTALTFQAKKLLKSDQVVGNANNDMNPLKGLFGGDPVVVPYLTDPDAWFLTTDADDSFKFFRRRPARLRRDNEFDTTNLKFATDTRFSTGWTNWRGVWGSAGA